MTARLSRRLALFSILVLTVSTTQAGAFEELKLEGTAFLDQEACSGGLKSKGCNLSFYLEGPAARQLYDGIVAKAAREECTGGLEKSDGKGLRCIKSSDGTYACDFGYHFGSRGFAASSMTC